MCLRFPEAWQGELVGTPIYFEHRRFVPSVISEWRLLSSSLATFEGS